jgi:2,3-bisphosphoglycerate-dependent phosphoglycerate mutase
MDEGKEQAKKRFGAVAYLSQLIISNEKRTVDNILLNRESFILPTMVTSKNVLFIYPILFSSLVGGFLLAPQGCRHWKSSMSASANNEMRSTGTNINNSDDSKPPKKRLGGAYKPIEVEEYEDYSPCLTPRQERTEVEAEFKKEKFWRKALRKVVSVSRRKKKRGSLILLRCGESSFNHNQTFTGWLDPPLTEQGIEECRHAGRLLTAEGFEPDVVYTSRLQRAIVSAWAILETLDLQFISVRKTYRLNQRMYGALQGLSKQETAKKFGPVVVDAWRNSIKARPPPMARDDPEHPVHDRRYIDIPRDRIPDTESLLECQERTRQLWDYKIRKDVEEGKTVLVVAHRDSLRGLCKVIDGISDEETGSIEIPNGVPIVYKFDKDMKLIVSKDPDATQVHTSGTFVEKPDRLTAAMKKMKRWNERFEGSGERLNKRMKPLEKSLLELRQVEEDLGPVIRNEYILDEKPMDEFERWSDDPCEFEEHDYFFESDGGSDVEVPLLPLENSLQAKKETMEGPFVVLVRHGRTRHNNMQLFTGWEDPPLAVEGVEDAKNAGRLLKRHGFEFDVVYTSWLTRAIQTAFYALEELDQVWLPIVKSWRLNERMYGALTGKSKNMIANIYGEDQLKKWRRGYSIRPPPTSSYSMSYPGNDERRAKHFKDLPISLKETVNRSIENRKLSIHRKFPKTESLKDCMDRSIPFYTERIQREAVDKGKRILIASHENAIRGILMHLCDIPEAAMNGLHLPNGLPMIYNVKGRCITLLDDGSGQDPMDSHDFGPAAKYLFKPCAINDAFYEEEMEAKSGS